MRAGPGRSGRRPRSRPSPARASGPGRTPCRSRPAIRPVSRITVRSGISPARYMTDSVLPVPGGPCSSSPRRMWRPLARSRVAVAREAGRVALDPLERVARAARSGRAARPAARARVTGAGRKGCSPPNGEHLAAVDVVLAHQLRAARASHASATRAAAPCACSLYARRGAGPRRAGASSAASGFRRPRGAAGGPT